MKKRLGFILQAAGGLLLFFLACASDMGAVSVGGLAAGLPGAALLFFAGRRLARQRKPAVRRRMTVVIPLGVHN